MCSVTFQVEQLFVAVILNPSFDSAAVAATADSSITLKRPIIVLYIRSLFLCSFCLLMHDISKTFSSIEGHKKKMNGFECTKHEREREIIVDALSEKIQLIYF